MNHTGVIKQLKSAEVKPIYLLHGAEPYYIDLIVDFAAKNILDEGERDFNQTIFYAKDTPPINVVDAAVRLPMMAERQVIIVKEAQEYKNSSQWEVFEKYFESPSSTTILIFAFKYKKFDKRTKAFKLLSKSATIFESEQIKDYKLPEWVKNYLKEKDYLITDKAVALICEHVGNDLERIANELEKLFILVPSGTQINEKHIEDHIGISKDFNVFELVNAVLEKEVQKAYQIVHYFESNPKATHITVVLANLHTLYQRLFKTHFLKTDDPRQIASKVGVHPFVAKQLLTHKRKHPPKKISQVFSVLREYDMHAKGVTASGIPDAELMKELVHRLIG